MSELAFADSETRSLLDVTKVGAYRYAQHESTEALVWAWAFDDKPGRVWSPPWAYDAEHDSIYELYEHIRAGGYFIAWNAFFDRHIWNSVMVKKYDAPYLPLEQVLCAQAQGEANNLPGPLGKAAECLGTYNKKDPQGKRLINLLSHGTREDWDYEANATPERMGHFRAYGLHDVYSMRDIWQHTRPLTIDEWDEYHASERINDRGVAVDHEFAGAAMRYAEAEFADINGRLAEVADDPDMTVTNHVRKAAWLHDQLWPDEELQEAVTKPPKRKGGPIRKSCDRATREAVLEVLNQPEHGELFHVEHREKIVEFLELIEAGNSAAVRKFTAIFNQEIAGRIHGQYSFNGAGQTGRFSSRGVQIHNLIRDPVEKKNPDRALDAIDRILAGADPDDLVAEFGYPVSRLLARLIRPTFIAPDGRALVWADYDQIEGRVLPWLADSPQAEAKLDLYRAGIDTYKVAAMPIYGLASPDLCDDQQRQVGKVAELALGFGGAVGAFSAMSRGYGVVVPEADAAQIVTAWRIQNAWAPAFWHELWEAAISAYNAPGQWWRAGRVHYMYHPMMRGTLICRLPSGRWLVYPQFKHEWVEYEDDDGVRQRKLRTSYVKGFGSGSARVDLWYGVLAENNTQAVAADFLRGVIVELDDILVLHTHDEIVAEVDDTRIDACKKLLTETMTWLPEWAEGLPLSVSVEHGPYYTK
jgi:DNA polymerase